MCFLRSRLTFRLWRNLLSSMWTHTLSPPTFCPLFFLSLRILLTHTLRNFMDILDRVALLFEMSSSIISTCRIRRPCENLNTMPYNIVLKGQKQEINVQTYGWKGTRDHKEKKTYLCIYFSQLKRLAWEWEKMDLVLMLFLFRPHDFLHCLQMRNIHHIKNTFLLALA